MDLKQFLEKYNGTISLVLSILGLLLSFFTSDSNVLIIRLVVAFLFFIILCQIIVTDRLRKQIDHLKTVIIRLNNTVDNITLEVLNRFRNTPENNLTLNFEEIHQTVKIEGFDTHVECESKGRCKSMDGEDSYHCEIYGDSTVDFKNLNYRFIDLKNNPTHQQIPKGSFIKEYNKMFLVRNRFSKKLNHGDSFHFKYICLFPNCMANDDYYTIHLPSCQNGLKLFEFSIIFTNEQPVSVEVFDGTHGGEGKFVKELYPETSVKPFSYKHVEENIVGIKDFVYIFRRSK